ncbi:MAG: hypothetical protein KGK08_04885 [Acidobacteriota bacterium]|nr:hypothetical protein [Acidobacteriota bacterium]
MSVNTQPINPVQTCTPVGSSGTIGTGSVVVQISCVAGTATTVNAASSSVTIDPAVPASAVNAIVSVDSVLDSAKPGSPLYVPVSEAGGVTLVVAVDASGNMLLAADTASGSANLTADSTAIALVRMSLGAVPEGSNPALLDGAIQATAGYPALLSAINSALAQGIAPSTQNAVYAAILTVSSQLPSAAVSSSASIARKVRSNVSFDAPLDSPYTLYSFPSLPGTSTSTGSLGVTGANSDGSVNVQNTTFIAWSLASADTSGNLLGCATPGSAPKYNPDCSVLVGRTGLLARVGVGSISSVAVSGIPYAFNLTLEQNTISKRANAIALTEDIVTTVISYYTAGKASPALNCVSGVVNYLLPPTKIASLVANTSASTFQSQLWATLGPSGPLASLSALASVVGNVSACGANIGLPASLAGANPAGGSSVLGSLGSFLSGYANFMENQFLKGVIGIGNASLTAGGIGIEGGEMLATWNFAPKAVGVCEDATLTNCAVTLQFSPNPLTFTTLGGSGTPQMSALDDKGNPTLWPPDVEFSLPTGSPSGLSVNSTSGNVTVAAGTPAGTYAVNALDQSTGYTGSFSVVVSPAPPQQSFTYAYTIVFQGVDCGQSVSASFSASTPSGTSASGSSSYTGTVCTAFNAGNSQPVWTSIGNGSSFAFTGSVTTTSTGPGSINGSTTDQDVALCDVEVITYEASGNTNYAVYSSDWTGLCKNGGGPLVSGPIGSGPF